MKFGEVVNKWCFPCITLPRVFMILDNRGEILWQYQYLTTSTTSFKSKAKEAPKKETHFNGLVIGYEDSLSKTCYALWLSLDTASRIVKLIYGSMNGELCIRSHHYYMHDTRTYRWCKRCWIWKWNFDVGRKDCLWILAWNILQGHTIQEISQNRNKNYIHGCLRVQKEKWAISCF